MACMGPEISHAALMAERMTETIVAVLAQHGVVRPSAVGWSGVGYKIVGLWDEEVEELTRCLQKLIELDACAIKRRGMDQDVNRPF